MSFILTSFFKLLRRNKHSALLAGFVALLLEGLFESWWTDSEVKCGFWFFLLIGLL